MQWPPAVVVHGFDHACTALACARPVTLLSGFGAGVYGGVGWWKALVEAARGTLPGAYAPDILDCADAPGAAMAALRLGQPAVILDRATPAFSAVAGAAATCGALLLDVRPPALDLAAPGAARALAAWLTREPG